MSPFGGGNAPETTGSIPPPLEVQRPLPETLAYSDATKIGEAASAVLAQAEGAVPEDWTNASTGSSGTIERGSGAASEDCRPFTTIVTSVSGVHSYSGTLCQQAGGRASVRLAEPGESGT
jgi:hypothetical protein